MWLRDSGKPAASWGGLVRSELTDLLRGSHPYNLSHEAWLPKKQVNLPTGSSKWEFPWDGRKRSVFPIVRLYVYLRCRTNFTGVYNFLLQFYLFMFPYSSASSSSQVLEGGETCEPFSYPWCSVDRPSLGQCKQLQLLWVNDGKTATVTFLPLWALSHSLRTSSVMVSELWSQSCCALL